MGLRQLFAFTPVFLSVSAFPYYNSRNLDGRRQSA